MTNDTAVEMHDLGCTQRSQDPLPRFSPANNSIDSGNLPRLPIFDRVEDAVVRRVVESSAVKHFHPGDVIVAQGQPLFGLHIVLRGIVDLTRINGEHECGVLLLSAKDLLMPSATLFNEMALVSARALTNAKVMVSDQAAVEWAIGHSPSFATNVMKAMSGQWRMAVRTILDLNCRSAAQRLGAFLLRIADLQPDAETSVLPIPKRHLAVRLGMTAETLSRMLQVVARHGLYLRGRTIIIRDRAEIEKFCGPSPYPANDERALDVFAL